MAGRKCTVCHHPKHDAIDSLLVAGMLSNRRIGVDFDLTERAVREHKSKHLATRLVKAVERRAERMDDLFMERHEHLNREAMQYVEDAKLAIKMQKVTVKDDYGKIVGEEYKEFRDVGAMSPALTVASNLNRVLGEATGRFVKDVSNEDRKPFVIILSQGPIVETSHATIKTAQSVALLEDPQTIDVKALGD